MYLIHDSDSPSHRKMYTGLLVRGHLSPIWPPVLPLNLTYILILLLPLSWVNLPYTYFWCSKFQIASPFSWLRSIIQRISPCPRFLVNFRNKLIFYGEDLLAPRPTLKLEDHPLSAVRDCLFNIFTATLHIWRPFPPSATWGRAMPWWQGTHLTWKIWLLHFKSGE
jgi:hypothetical protein